MNLNIGDVTKSIGANQIIVENNLNDLRELLKQLKDTKKPIQSENIQNQDIQNQDIQESNLSASDEQYLYDGNDGNYNSPFNNSSSESGAGSGSNATIPTLQLPNQFDPSTTYNYKDITLYHDVASNEASTQGMSIQDKYNIIINAEKRINYLKNTKNTNSEEYKALNDIFDKCNKTSDHHCQKIKIMWNGIQERKSPHTSPRSSRPSSPISTPRVVQNNIRPNSASNRVSNRVRLPPITNTNTKRGGKRRSTIKHNRHRKTKRHDTNKKARTLKKRH